MDSGAATNYGFFIKRYREVFSGDVGKDCACVCTGVWNTGKRDSGNKYSVF